MSTENMNDQLPISWVKSVTNDGKIYYKNNIDNAIRWEGSNEYKQEEYNIIDMTNYGSFKWNINGQQYGKIIQSKVGEIHQSQIFQIANLKWRIECCPNGRNEQQKDSFDIFIRLLNIPNEWKSILVQWQIKCIETNASYTWTSTYDNNNTCEGWPDRKLLLSELTGLHLNEINILISLKIIRIVSNNSNNILYYNIIPMKTNETIKWNINKNILTQFNNSYGGKSFESPINNNTQFIIKCYPNGATKDYEGYMSLFLSLIHFPFPNISKIKIKYILSCDQIGINYTNTYIFSIEDNVWGKLKFCKYNKFKPNSLNWFSNSLTLTANYKMLSIYDLNGKEFPINKKTKFICSKKYNYSQIFCNTLTWKCIKCKQINKQKYISCTKCNLHREYNKECYLKKLTFKEIKEQVSKWSNTIPNYNNILMKAAVKEDNNGIVFHTLHPSYQTLTQLVKDCKENKTNSFINNRQSENESNVLMSSNEYNKDEQKQSINNDTNNKWSCPLCTFENEYRNNQCVMCNSENKENESSEEYMVKIWLKNEVKLPEYIPIFLENGYDDMFTITESINEKELLEMGINNRGHRKQIILFANRYTKPQYNNDNGNVPIINELDEVNVYENIEEYYRFKRLQVQNIAK